MGEGQGERSERQEDRRHKALVRTVAATGTTLLGHVERKGLC